MNYYIKIKGTPVPVSEEIYKAYCQGERKERYFRESDIRNRTFFYDALDTDELNGRDLFGDSDAESVEDAAEKHLLLEKLRCAVSALNPEEKNMLRRLYIYEDSLRALSRESHIPVSTLYARHQKLLKKLREKIEI